MNLNIRGRLYRMVMRISHKYNWHYAPPSYPDGDTLLWCHWCGFRQIIHKVQKPNPWTESSGTEDQKSARK